MYINPINKNQNICLKAKLTLLSEKNLLPKGAVQKLVEKAKTVRNPGDIISVVVQKNNWSRQTVIHGAFLKFPSGRFTDQIATAVSGSFKKKQEQAFNVISRYIDSLSKN